MRAIAFAFILLLLADGVLSQSSVVEYHMGGSLTNGVVTKFVFDRNGDVTTVTWQQFGAEANGSGVVVSKLTDSFPDGYPFSNLYRGFPPTGLIRWTYIYEAKVAAVRISNVPPVVTVVPTDVAAFASGQIVTVRSGSITFLNTDVNLNGQPGTIGGLLTTLESSTSATTALATGTVTTGLQSPSTTAMALEISIPLAFIVILVLAITI